MFLSLKDLVLSPITVELVINKDGNFAVFCTEPEIEGEINTFNREIVEKNGVKGIIL